MWDQLFSCHSRALFIGIQLEDFSNEISVQTWAISLNLEKRKWKKKKKIIHISVEFSCEIWTDNLELSPSPIFEKFDETFFTRGYAQSDKNVYACLIHRWEQTNLCMKYIYTLEYQGRLSEIIGTSLACNLCMYVIWYIYTYMLTTSKWPKCWEQLGWQQAGLVSDFIYSYSTYEYECSSPVLFLLDWFRIK